MDEAQDCRVCRTTAAPDLPPRERVLLTARWRAAHAFDTALPGWLVLLPTRHVTALDQLTDAEAAELGPLLRRLTAALRTVVGATKTYVMLLAEAEGFAHVHFHVVPRMPDQPPEVRGPRVFDLLGVPEERSVPADERDRLALALAAALDEP